MSMMNFNDTLQANLGFVLSQTSHIEADVFEIEYPDVDYASLVPVDTSAADWAKTVTYFSMDKAGAARWLNANANDVPVVSTALEKFETPIYTAGIGYDYGFEEVNQARQLGQSLESMKVMAARRAYEEMVYDVALIGDEEKGFDGLFNHPAVPQVVVPNGASGNPAWSQKTPDEIIQDINDMIVGVHAQTNTVSFADTIILPYSRFNDISSRRIPDVHIPVIEYVKKYNAYTAHSGRELKIVGERRLDNAGVGNTARMIAYTRSPDVLKLHIPVPHTFLAPQIEGFRFLIPGFFRLGGLDIRLPLKVRYGDGI